MKTIEFNLNIYEGKEFEYVHDDMIRGFRDISDYIKMRYKNSKYCTIVMISTNIREDRSGYENIDIHVFPSFFEANDTINNNINKASAVQIYQYNLRADSFINLIDKWSCNKSYSRDIDIEAESLYDDMITSRIETLHNSDTKIYVH